MTSGPGRRCAAPALFAVTWLTAGQVGRRRRGVGCSLLEPLPPVEHSRLLRTRRRSRCPPRIGVAGAAGGAHPLRVVLEELDGRAAVGARHLEDVVGRPVARGPDRGTLCPSSRSASSRAGRLACGRRPECLLAVRGYPQAYCRGMTLVNWGRPGQPEGAAAGLALYLLPAPTLVVRSYAEVSCSMRWLLPYCRNAVSPNTPIVICEPHGSRRYDEGARSATGSLPEAEVHNRRPGSMTSRSRPATGCTRSRVTARASTRSRSTTSGASASGSWTATPTTSRSCDYH